MRKVLKLGLSVYIWFLSRILFSLYYFISRIPRGKFVTSEFLSIVRNEIFLVHTDRARIKFSNTSWITEFRAKNFLQQEPETISWIESFPLGSVFWDVGANIGSYSLYAASLGHQVIAFEPSPWNQDTLARNIINNEKMDCIVMVPIALSDSTTVTSLYLSRDFEMPGGAHNSVKAPLNQFGEVVHDSIELRVLGATADMLMDLGGIPQPDFIKIDVDGMELEVLQGSLRALESATSVLIESRQNHPNHQQIFALLRGLDFDLTIYFDRTSNSIWTKRSLIKS